MTRPCGIKSADALDHYYKTELEALSVKVMTTLVDYRVAHRVVWREHQLNVQKLGKIFSVKDVGFTDDAMITRWRSMMLTEFEKSDAEVFLWMDADIVASSYVPLIEGALKTKGIVSAMVAKRKDGDGIAAQVSKEECDKTLGDNPPDLLVATRAGAGLQAIHVDALRKIGKDMVPVASGIKPFCMEMISPENKWLSEDYSLCYRALEASVPIHVSTRVEALHIGDRYFKVNDGVKEDTNA